MEKPKNTANEEAEKKKSSAEDSSESGEKNGEKTEARNPLVENLEKANEVLDKCLKEQENFKGSLAYFEKIKNPTAEQASAIKELKKEISIRKDKEDSLRDKQRIANLEYQVVELIKLQKEKKTESVGLTLEEAKKVVAELEKKKDGIENPKAVEKSPKLKRLEANVNELKKDIESIRKGISYAGVDARQMQATLLELEKEKAALEKAEGITLIKEDLKADGATIESSAKNTETETENENIEKGESEAVLDKKKYIPEEAEGIFNEAYEKHKKKLEGKSKWKWVWERTKGLATFGFAELHQAEKFRSKTKETSKEIMSGARKIQQIKRLDLTTALEEADFIRNEADNEKLVSKEGEIPRTVIEKYSEMVTEQKKESNVRIINSIIENSTKKLQEELKKYKDEYGNSVVTTNKLDAYRMQLKKELEALQSGFLHEDELKGRGEFASKGSSGVREAILANPDAFKKTIRKVLDAEYYLRYFYAAGWLTFDTKLYHG